MKKLVEVLSGMKSSQGLAPLVIVAVVAAVLVVGGGVGYFLTDGYGMNKKSQESAQGDETDKSSAAASSQQSKSGQNNSSVGGTVVEMLSSAISGGSAIECRVKGIDGDGSEVKAIVKDDKHFRAEPINPSQDGKEGYVLRDGDFVYIWQSGEKEGFKMNLAKARVDEDDDTMLSVEKIRDYASEHDGQVNCQPTTVSAATFRAPANVTFKEFSL